MREVLIASVYTVCLHSSTAAVQLLNPHQMTSLILLNLILGLQAANTRISGSVAA